jgi:site-specific recombinase XerD
VTLGSLTDAYLRERIRRHEITPLSARNIRCSLRSFAKVFGDRQVRMLSQRDVERWLETRSGLSAATRRSGLSDVRSFCLWLVRRGYVRVDPTAEIPPVKVPRRLPRALPAKRVTKLLSVVPDRRAMLMCLLMVQEGLRCSEVAGLQVGDIDFLDRTARVVGKGGHERFLPLSEETWRALEAYLQEHPATSGPLVRSYLQEWRGLAADTISGMVSNWMSEAGIKRYARDGVSAHALRHTSATDMLRAGAHLRDVQHALGHAHLATTETYLPLVVHDLREAMGGRSYRHPSAEKGRQR